MRCKKLASIIAALGLQFGVVVAAEAATVCRSALTPELGLEVSQEGMSVLLGEHGVYRVPDEVWRQVWPEPRLPFDLRWSFNCVGNVASDSDMLIALVHSRDGSHALAFGLLRDADGKPVGISSLQFHAHDPIYEFRYVGPRETEWVFGRAKDLVWRVCWNKNFDGKWIVGRGWRYDLYGSPCDVEAPTVAGWSYYGHVDYAPINNPG